jgi:hypothetical protein
MDIVFRAALVGLALMSTSSLAIAARRGGGVPGCEQAVTNVPWGTTDTSCVGGPPGPNGWTGGMGGPGMRITPEAHKNWPNFPAPVAGDPVPAPAQPVR